MFAVLIAVICVGIGYCVGYAVGWEKRRRLANAAEKQLLEQISELQCTLSATDAAWETVQELMLSEE